MNLKIRKNNLTIITEKENQSKLPNLRNLDYFLANKREFKSFELEEDLLQQPKENKVFYKNIGFSMKKERLKNEEVKEYKGFHKNVTFK